MILNNVKPFKAIDKNETNMQKASAYLEVGKDPKQSYLYSTNGRILAKIPVDGTGDTSGFVSYDALEAVNKQKPLQAIVANGDLKVVNGATFTRPDINKQINYEVVLENIPPSTITIKLDIKLLSRLAEALGDNQVTLSISSDPLKAIKVETKNGIGAIMPMKI